MTKKKATNEEELQIRLHKKLNNFNPSEVESYLLALLDKCLEATAQKDFLTLGNVEDLLNKSLIILGSKIQNFNLFYSNLRLKAVTKFLAKYIEVNESEAFTFLTVLPEFVTLEEGAEVTNSSKIEISPSQHSKLILTSVPFFKIVIISPS